MSTRNALKRRREYDITQEISGRRWEKRDIAKEGGTGKRYGPETIRF